MKFRATNPELRMQRSMANRARQFKCPVIIPFTKREVVKRDGLNCYYCYKELTYEQVTIDHLTPLSRGGFHCLSNVKVCCLSCNTEKKDKTLSEFLEYKKNSMIFCKNCGKEFNKQTRNIIHCSWKCRVESGRILKECVKCQKVFSVQKSRPRKKCKGCIKRRKLKESNGY